MSTLSQFTTYVETANNNQRLDIEHIQAYVVDELQRQNAAANHTKQICEQKLVELQYQLEDVTTARACSFYPRDAVLARLLAMALCLCLSHCLSRVGVLSNRLNESGWFLAWELLSAYPSHTVF